MPPVKPAAKVPVAKDGGAEKKGKAKAKGAKVAAAEVPQTDADKLAAALVQLEASSTRISTLEQQCGRAVLERDRVTEFFEIARAEAEDIERSCRFKDVDLEKEEDRHLIELKDLRQRIKHLVYGHDRSVAALKSEADAAAASTLVASSRRLEEDQAERTAIKALSREQASKHAEAIAAQQLDTVKSLAKLRAELLQSSEELEARETWRATLAASDAALLMRSAIGEVEERKGDHAADLKASHLRAMSELRTEYEGALEARLVAAAAAKDASFKMEQRAEATEAALSSARSENDGLRASLATAQAAVSELQTQLTDYIGTKAALKNTKGRLSEAANHLKSLEWDHEIQRQELEELRKAHNILLDHTQANELEAWRLALKHAGISTSQNNTRGGNLRATMPASVPHLQGIVTGRSSTSSTSNQLPIVGSSTSSQGDTKRDEEWKPDHLHTFARTTVEEVFGSEAPLSSAGGDLDQAAHDRQPSVEEADEDLLEESEYSKAAPLGSKIPAAETDDNLASWENADSVAEEDEPTDSYLKDSTLSDSSSPSRNLHVAVEA